MEKVLTVEMQIAERARKYPDEALTNLHEFIDVPLLHGCFDSLNKRGASGVDAETWKDYNEQRGERIPQLLAAFKSGKYRAPNIRRVYIPKGDGKLRPLGLPTVEDKLLGTAVSRVLTPVYEQLFHPTSYGFRPGKSQHQALEELSREVSFKGKRYIIDADMQNYFGSIDHRCLREFLDRKIKDGVIRKMIDKWLKAGVLENGQVVYPTEGTPQGGTIAPRTHPQTLCFPGGFRLKEEDFKYCYIKSSIFMKHGTITELRINQADQSNLQFTEERNAAFPDCQPVNGAIWNFPDSGISLYTESSGESGKGSHSGGYYRVHCKTSSQLDQKDQKICAFPRAIYQQSGANCAGRVPVKEGSWQKRRDKLKWRIATTVCGSKSFLRFTIFLSHQLIIIISPLNGPLLN
jgi:hypothetical protein